MEKTVIIFLAFVVFACASLYTADIQAFPTHELLAKVEKAIFPGDTIKPNKVTKRIKVEETVVTTDENGVTHEKVFKKDTTFETTSEDGQTMFFELERGPNGTYYSSRRLADDAFRQQEVIGKKMRLMADSMMYIFSKDTVLAFQMNQKMRQLNDQMKQLGLRDDLHDLKWLSRDLAKSFGDESARNFDIIIRNFDEKMRNGVFIDEHFTNGMENYVDQMERYAKEMENHARKIERKVEKYYLNPGKNDGAEFYMHIQPVPPVPPVPPAPPVPPMPTVEGYYQFEYDAPGDIKIKARPEGSIKIITEGHSDVKRTIINQLTTDGVVQGSKVYSFRLNENEFLVNGIKQSKKIHKKYKKEYLKSQKEIEYTSRNVYKF